MDISKVKVKGTWRDVADVARTTIGKEEGEGSVSDSWKKRMLLAEHSPIRLLWFRWKWKGIKYWVSVHLVRHWLGIVHFVKSSRSDRTGVPRDELPQNHAVNHECDANAQALINISRRRLCKQASLETQEAWKLVKQEVAVTDPIMASVMVPDCIYRGGICREMNCCGWIKTQEAQSMWAEYNTYQELAGRKLSSFS